MLVWLLEVLGGYGLGALMTARAVFAYGRAGYLSGPARGRVSPHSVAEFERREREHVEAIALCAALLWVVAVPVLLLRQFVTRVLFARGCTSTPEPKQVLDSIDELERALGMGRYAGGVAVPVQGRAARVARAVEPGTAGGPGRSSRLT
ncbi:hypothetical protein C7C46_15475 [Streptomyces tateyamensis]|uniref:Uncharacterized protein n=1 Tax=Streptomyces tateyamensis TaxID=565073 RepID=A0A2V4N3S1_9ACTN|nr:hypothetical protein [Streptomyces tateyamensis]PYC78696.1 hypothetical protein C7C46_15475 [Streptomyces tateyamensis]